MKKRLKSTTDKAITKAIAQINLRFPTRYPRPPATSSFLAASGRIGGHQNDVIGDSGQERLRGIETQRQTQFVVQIIGDFSLRFLLDFSVGIARKIVFLIYGKEEECVFEGRVLVVGEPVQQQNRFRRKQIQVFDDDDPSARSLWIIGCGPQMASNGIVHGAFSAKRAFVAQLNKFTIFMFKLFILLIFFLQYSVHTRL